MEFDPSQPIWRQILAECTRRIAVGSWPPGSKIPGVRELASELGVNPNTVQRALSELERDGLCHSERTSGRFVTTDVSIITTAKMTLAKQAGQTFLGTAKGLDMTLTDTTNLITTLWKDQSPHE